MKSFTPSFFFDLSQFLHNALFKDLQFAWQAIEKISTYLNSLKLGEIRTDIPNTAYVMNPELISIGEGSTIEPGAFIQGPCVIGKNCKILHCAYIRGNVIVGDNSVVGHTTEIKNSIMLNNAHAAHFAYIGDSIIGNNVNLGAGVKCANLRLDKKPIIVRFDEGSVDTGLRKFGAVIGDYSSIGCNSVLNPGTVLEKNCAILPNETLKGYVNGKPS